MPQHILLVHNDRSFMERVAAALRRSGHEVTGCLDPVTALARFEAGQEIDLLITRVRFPLGKPNGMFLARMAWRRYPSLRVLFVALPQFVAAAREIGAVALCPVRVPDLVAEADRLLHAPPSALRPPASHSQASHSQGGAAASEGRTTAG